MKEVNLIYAGLRSTYHEVEDFLRKSKTLSYHDIPGGFQRALVVARDPHSKEIERAYSTAGYFLNGFDETGDIIFEKEREWDEKEVSARLRRGGEIFNYSTNVNGYGLTLVSLASFEEFFYKYTGAFSKLKSAHEKSAKASEKTKLEDAMGRVLVLLHQ